MTKAELLAELRNNYLRDTTTSVGGPTVGVQWGDASLLRHLDDGYTQFATDTRCLRDSTTTSVCNITLVEGQDTYAIDPKVVAVVQARIDGAFLSAGNAPTMFGTGEACDAQNQAGLPRVFFGGEAGGELRVWPVPDEDAAGKTLNLLVARLPLATLAGSADSYVPELHPSDHMALVEFAAHALLRNHDAALSGDANNMAIVQAFASAHKKAYTERVEACIRRLRRRTNMPVVFSGMPNWR